VPEHLEVLDDVPGCGVGVREGVGEADAFDRRLGDPADLGQRFERPSIGWSIAEGGELAVKCRAARKDYYCQNRPPELL
jgi:hypothetical protein